MMYEIKSGGEGRWFQDEYFDLYTWELRGKVVRFQLAYDKGWRSERIVTWSEGGGFSHCAVDNGPGAGGYPATPILVADGVFDWKAIAQKFRERSGEIERRIADEVHRLLLGYDG